MNNLDGLFLLDTGAPELILDPEFAKYANVPMTVRPGAPAASGSGVFGRVAKVILPGLEMDDVPAMMLNTKGLSALARKKRLAGVIGTEFLSHFRPTLDYVHDRLILEPHDAPARTGGAIAEIPFWFIGDHFLVAPGRLDKAPKQLFLVDTGLGSYAFTAPQSSLHDAAIPVPTPNGAPRGASSPGATFPIARLSLGSLEEKNLQGVYGAFPIPLENALGVHVGGIVSHAFFHPYSVTFDFVRMTIAIRK